MKNETERIFISADGSGSLKALGLKNLKDHEKNLKAPKNLFAHFSQNIFTLFCLSVFAMHGFLFFSYNCQSILLNAV